jgi:hypothetical protein
MTKAEIKDLAPIPAVVIICLNPREARVEVLGMTNRFSRLATSSWQLKADC